METNRCLTAVRMRLHYRVRCHISAVLHRLSMHSWPLLPLIDRKLLDAVFNVNSQFVHDRQFEYALLDLRFPELTRFALDTNSFRFEPTRYHSAPRPWPWQRAKAVHLRRSAGCRYGQRRRASNHAAIIATSIQMGRTGSQHGSRPNHVVQLWLTGSSPEPALQYDIGPAPKSNSTAPIRSRAAEPCGC